MLRDVFQVVYASGTRPAYNSGWSQEAALDIEWSHALAPTAKIVLVEAASNSFTNLLAAVDFAGANLAASSPRPSAGSAYDFRDIVSGSAGRFRCTLGWDLVTGVGSDWGLNGK